MALKIRIEPTISSQERMINAMRRHMKKNPDLPVIPDRDRALVRFRCYDCEATTVWAPESSGTVQYCDSCKEEHEKPREPQEMIVRHVVEHVQSEEFSKMVVH